MVKTDRHISLRLHYACSVSHSHPSPFLEENSCGLECKVMLVPFSQIWMLLLRSPYLFLICQIQIWMLLLQSAVSLSYLSKSNSDAVAVRVSVARFFRKSNASLANEKCQFNAKCQKGVIFMFYCIFINKFSKYLHSCVNFFPKNLKKKIKPAYWSPFWHFYLNFFHKNCYKKLPANKSFFLSVPVWQKQVKHQASVKKKTHKI